jgi:hypothetical protein
VLRKWCFEQPPHLWPPRSALDYRVVELQTVRATLEKLMEFENKFAGNVVTFESPMPRFSLADRIQF